jgi:hypothetical protein
VTDSHAWIDLVLSRSAELRRAGIASIGIAGCTATFVPADPEPIVTDDDGGDADPAWSEPMNPWEDPASYPSGIVPRLEIDNLPDPRRDH